MNYIETQQALTSDSRGTRMGKRVIRNVIENIKYLKPPILCVGAGDGYEIEQIAKALDIKPDIEGIEITPERVKTAKLNGIWVEEGGAEDIPEVFPGETFNSVYCSHTLEHTRDKVKVIDNFKKICTDTVVIIVPIEPRNEPFKPSIRNKSHVSPINNLGYLANLFGCNWQVLDMHYCWDLEFQGVLVMKKHPMNWPTKFAHRTGEQNARGLLESLSVGVPGIIAKASLWPKHIVDMCSVVDGSDDKSIINTIHDVLCSDNSGISERFNEVNSIEDTVQQLTKAICMA